MFFNFYHLVYFWTFIFMIESRLKLLVLGFLQVYPSAIFIIFFLKNVLGLYDKINVKLDKIFARLQIEIFKRWSDLSFFFKPKSFVIVISAGRGYLRSALLRCLSSFKLYIAFRLFRTIQNIDRLLTRLQSPHLYSHIRSVK